MRLFLGDVKRIAIRRLNNHFPNAIVGFFIIKSNRYVVIENSSAQIVNTARKK